MPKYMILSSDDEFMQFEWTNLYYDKLGGEKHLYIMPNAEHEMVTAYRRKFSNLASFVHSIAAGKPFRPNFDYTYDNTTGELSVKLNEQSASMVKAVRLIYAETLSTQRRDFRWLFQSNENTEPCKLPYIPIPNDLMERKPHLKAAKDLCFAPIIWSGLEIAESEEPGVYKTLPPEPREGHWMGYYVEVEFYGDAPQSGDSLFPNHFTFTTPGHVWPNTMPFEDCVKEGCWSKWV